MLFFRGDNIQIGHFNLREFQCKCGICKEQLIEIDLIDRLNLLRKRVGVPVTITSGYRCPRHNAVVGGVPSSKHLSGKAADIKVEGKSGKEIFDAAKEFFGRIGIGKDWCHVDIGPGANTWLYEL